MGVCWQYLLHRTHGLCLPSPSGRGNEALLGIWVNSWAKQEREQHRGCCNKVQP